jgi:hypothetical protein
LLLSFFSEIVISEACGRLIFSLVSDARDDKHDDRYDVRKHLKERCCAHSEVKLTNGLELLFSLNGEMIGFDD